MRPRARRHARAYNEGEITEQYFITGIRILLDNHRNSIMTDKLSPDVTMKIADGSVPTPPDFIVRLSPAKFGYQPWVDKPRRLVLKSVNRLPASPEYYNTHALSPRERLRLFKRDMWAWLSWHGRREQLHVRQTWKLAKTPAGKKHRQRIKAQNRHRGFWPS